MTGLHLHASGPEDGEPVVLVHGSFSTGPATFPALRPLRDRYRLLVVDRRGYGGSPAAAPGVAGWPVDRDDVAALLEELGGAHLVGHSYGGVVALLVAGARPDLVRSLVVVEPPLFAISRHPEAVALTAALDDLRAQGAHLDIREYTTRFFWTLTRTPREDVERFTSGWSDADWAAAEASRREEPPMRAPVDLAALRALTAPQVVATGGWPAELAGEGTRCGEAFAAVADQVAAGTGAERVVFEHSTHSPQLTEPKGVAALLRRTWEAAAR